MIKNPGRFVFVWMLAVVACATALVLYLGFRVRAVEMGYELGELHKQSRTLRETKRVLELEVASYQTPERIEFIGRSLLGLAEPSWDRIIPVGPLPVLESRVTTDDTPDAAETPRLPARSPNGAPSRPVATPSVITGARAQTQP